MSIKALITIVVVVSAGMSLKHTVSEVMTDIEDYKTVSSCITSYLVRGIPRSDIVVIGSSCHFKQH